MTTKNAHNVASLNTSDLIGFAIQTTLADDDQVR